MSPGDIAFSHDDYDKAITLYREEAKAPGDIGARARSAMVRSLLREEKVADAEKEARTWLAADPHGTWSQLTLSEVMLRKGELDDAIRTFQQAYEQDLCNPQAHLDRAWILSFSDMNASALKELNIAHSLAPNDDEVESRWISAQPRKARLEALETYLKKADYLSDKERHAVEHWRDGLQKPPAPPCHVATPVTSVVIPYRAIQDGPHAPVEWGLDVSFNGKSRRLQIDTGASGLILSRSAAAALHLTSAASGRSFGMGDEGAAQDDIAHVDSIKIGSLEFRDCMVQVLTLKNRKVLSAEDGLIGGDVFSQFLLTLDFPGHLLKLDPLPPLPGSAQPAAPSLNTDAEAEDSMPHDRYVDPSMKDWTKVYGNSSHLILPVQLNSGPVRLFIVDTGAGSNLISPQAAREVSHVSRDDTFEIVGISGKVQKTYSTGPLSLSFGHLKQPTSGMESIDTAAFSRSAGTEISGFLGAPTLTMLTIRIDYRDKLVEFSYDPKRIQHCGVTSFGIGTCN